MLQPGDQLQSRYQIQQFISQGGMGAVYLANDSRLGGRQMAIKQMNPTNVLAQDREWALTAFEQEAQVLARLNHPNIARVTDFFYENQMWYLAMEFVKGETLEAALTRHPRGFLESQALLWGGQLGSVLDYLHHQNPPIIFRDLKPGNIMVQADGTLKLIDFGIARFFKPGQRQDTVSLGTPGYAAPEQYGKGQTDARSDVYSLGVVLHQLLTGYDPGLTPMNLPPVKQLQPQVSDHVAQAVNRALSIEPSQRFTSMREFAAALHISISGVLLPDVAPDTGTLPKESNYHWPTTFFIGGGLLLALFLLGWLAIVFAGLNGTDETEGPETNTQSEITQVVIVTATHTPSPTIGRLTVTAIYEETFEAAVAAAQESTIVAIAAANDSLTLTTEAQPTNTIRPTTTPSRTPVPTTRPPTHTPAPTPCAVTVNTNFQTTYNSNQSRLGCPLSAARTGTVVQEDFQLGYMFWRESNDKMYVIYNSGSWSIHSDIWVEGNAEFSCGVPESPPTPRRGFGKIWCNSTQVQTGLGNATNYEWALTATIQEFTSGLIWRTDAGLTFVLFSDGTWR